MPGCREKHIIPARLSGEMHGDISLESAWLLFHLAAQKRTGLNPQDTKIILCNVHARRFWRRSSVKTSRVMQSEARPEGSCTSLPRPGGSWSERVAWGGKVDLIPACNDKCGTACKCKILSFLKSAIKKHAREQMRERSWGKGLFDSFLA